MSNYHGMNYSSKIVAYIVELRLVTGMYLAGLLLGELLVRLCMLVEEIFRIVYHRQSFYTNVTKEARRIFSNEHNQIYKVLALLLVSVMFSAGGSDLQYFLQKIIPSSFEWFVMREIGAFHNLIEENETLSSRHADLGEFMALSFWLKFLEPFVAGNILQKMNQSACQYSKNFKCVHKLIILLPSNCCLNLDDNDLEKEGVFRHHGNCYEGCDSDHSIIFPSTCHGYSNIHQTLHWIYKCSTREENQEEKIVVMFHFPQILKSMMGPGRGWDEEIRPGGRQRNIQKMKDMLETLLKWSGYRDFQEYLIFYTFNNAKVKNKSLSDFLREKILMENVNFFDNF